MERRPNYPSKKLREQNLDWPSSLRPQIGIAKLIAERARPGKYLNLDLLREIDFSSEIDEGYALADLSRNMCAHSVIQYGEDGLGHLCLPMDYMWFLEWGGVATISQLAQKIEENSLQKIAKIGPTIEQRIKEAFYAWRVIQYKRS